MNNKKKKEGPYEIGELDFKDLKVKVFHDKDALGSNIKACWRMRNPDSCYKGFMNMNIETGEITYPEGAIIPVQTEEDREIIPIFIITGHIELNDTVLGEINIYLKTEHKRRNK